MPARVSARILIGGRSQGKPVWQEATPGVAGAAQHGLDRGARRDTLEDTHRSAAGPLRRGRRFPTHTTYRHPASARQGKDRGEEPAVREATGEAAYR